MGTARDYEKTKRPKTKTEIALKKQNKKRLTKRNWTISLTEAIKKNTVLTLCNVTAVS